MSKRPKALQNIIDFRYVQTVGFWERFQKFKQEDFISEESKFFILTHFAVMTADVVNSLSGFHSDEWEEEDEAIFPFLSERGKEFIARQEEIPGHEEIKVKDFHEVLVLKNVSIQPFVSKQTIKMQQMLLFSDQVVGMTFGEVPEPTDEDDE
ncbi:hypothetical protein P4637_19225 [Halalkalibacterium halodurans]|jgi:hypothetical protein|uniref:BH2685 protein n=2 Tax=Halalkalibacterium halodurans TaxID=86665 RepID=Q9K9G2_HALH5|nr:hypothetical protein [Halalkalibacterium halodurans]MDY7223219.1 hypothetical protein [Halalkalibacterium halodurans]MDY7242440.1 hypothetical protein [Halalkalibacterium halodurans]MED3646273.1 hypothetical protein [Halalkalibacterium halodurans]MED4081473.1 hypothetical protein [Halalkalibacterium halodurans]MED4086951.1 hypothetical protein [Halalkalibacterium halodurans]